MFPNGLIWPVKCSVWGCSTWVCVWVPGRRRSICAGAAAAGEDLIGRKVGKAAPLPAPHTAPFHLSQRALRQPFILHLYSSQSCSRERRGTHRLVAQLCGLSKILFLEWWGNPPIRFVNTGYSYMHCVFKIKALIPDSDPWYIWASKPLAEASRQWIWLAQPSALPAPTPLSSTPPRQGRRP